MVLLIGTNPRYEAPIFNTRLRKCWIHNELDVAVVGPKDVDLSYEVEHLGESADVVQQLADGKHPFSKRLAAAQKPVVIVGSQALQGANGGALLANVQRLAQNVRAQSGCGDSWRVLNVLHRVANQVR